MINLTPPFGKRTIRIEYALRVGAVYFFLLGGVFLSGAALLLPTYVLTRAQYDAALAVEESRGIKRDIFDAALSTFRDTNAMLVQLSSHSATAPKTRFIEDVVKSAPPGIVFNSFSFEVSEDGERHMILEGRSSNRASLVMFKSTLESSPLFREVDIPITDLARDVDSPFRMKLTIEGTNG